MRDQYRKEFAGFHGGLARAGHEYRAGHREAWNPAPVLDRYAGLFSLEAIAELRQEREAAPEIFPTLRSGLGVLLAFAERGWVEFLTDFRMAGLAGCGHAIGFPALEPDGDEPAVPPGSSVEHRRRRYRAHLEAVETGNADLLRRIAGREERARQLGHGSYRAMIEAHAGVDFGKTLAAVRPGVQRSEGAYRSRLAQAARVWRIRMEDGDRFDEVYVRGLDWYTRAFPVIGVEAILRDLLAGLGLRLDQLSNLEILDTAGRGPGLRAFCSPIQVPEEVKLGFDSGSGTLAIGPFFHAGGHALHQARTSPGLPVEFRLGGDPAVGEGYALLFESLILDPLWLAETIGFKAGEALMEAARLTRLMSVRRAVASLEYGMEPGEAGPAASRAGRYVTLLSEATGFRYHPAEYLREAAVALSSARSLRAAALEALIRERLRSGFGHRWWRRRKAGEFLLDLWSAGQRYPAEELVGLAGLGAWSFDPLWEELLAG